MNEERIEHMNDNNNPYLKGIHRNWTFWFFLLLMFVGIIYYIMTVDFAFKDHKPIEHSIVNNRFHKQ
jgi:hypothetical protein